MILSDLLVNEHGQLCHILGFSRVWEYGEFGFSQQEFHEMIVNQVVNYSDLEVVRSTSSISNEILIQINLGFNEQFVDRYKGW